MVNTYVYKIQFNSELFQTLYQSTAKPKYLSTSESVLGHPAFSKVCNKVCWVISKSLTPSCGKQTEPMSTACITYFKIHGEEDSEPLFNYCKKEAFSLILTKS